MDRPEYIEDEVLTDYVWNHYQYLFTRLEQLGGKAVFAEEKASAASSPAMAKAIIGRWGAQNDPQVVAALNQGVKIFRTRVKERLLREHTSEIFINRCPECMRIVRTPRAKQCLWCGHDWHGKV